MILGTNSNAGKSFLVTALCRIASNNNIKVVPFKAQNMSNNTAISIDNGEISRVQWIQSIASRIPATTNINPILIKPMFNSKNQIVINGKIKYKKCTYPFSKNIIKNLKINILNNFEKLINNNNLIIVEGAGSISEINLKKWDLCNMGFAALIGCPVILISDIDHGGVFASIIGTKYLLSKNENNLIKGFIINKFKGNHILLMSTLITIQKIINWKYYGTIKSINSASFLPFEDSIYMIKNKFTLNNTGIVINLPYISNLDDFDSLRFENDFNLLILRKVPNKIKNIKFVIIPGSKSVFYDLIFLYENEWYNYLKKIVINKILLIGICGGYQMLGEKIFDNSMSESNNLNINGLKFLKIKTKILKNKVVKRINCVSTQYCFNIKGYFIHSGRTWGPDCKKPILISSNYIDGAISDNNKIWGTYLHGIFNNDNFRNVFLSNLNIKPKMFKYNTILDSSINSISKQVKDCLNDDLLYSIIP